MSQQSILSPRTGKERSSNQHGAYDLGRQPTIPPPPETFTEGFRCGPKPLGPSRGLSGGTHSQGRYGFILKK